MVGTGQNTKKTMHPTFLEYPIIGLFNFYDGLPKLIAVVVAGAIIGCASYLKQSPLPGAP